MYDAWGNLISSTGETENSYLYCGEQLDSTTGLYYLRTRYMNPTTGTFITQDTYAGTIFDPVSLHKYLYANANPVMYTDPSGYFGLATIQHDSFAIAVWRSFRAGFVIGGLDVYRQLRTTGQIDWTHVLETAFVTTGVGVVFGGSAILAATLKSAAIYAALGGSCFTFFGLSLAQAQADGEAGYYDLMFLDLVFSGLSLKGANDCFNAAYQTATASKTAKSTTNLSVSNTNTAKSSSSASTNEPKRGTLSNVETRKWYLEQESKIPNLIDKSLALEEQAKQAFTLRNQYRTQARELMADRQAAEALNKSDPNMTWEEIVNKYISKGFSGDELYQEIINSSQRSRQSVNESLGLGAQ